MPADVETMAYRNENAASRPWHGLGNAIDHDATPEEMLTASELDWTVSKRPLFAPAAKPSATETPNLDNLMSVPDYFALVRDSDNKVFGPCGKEYVPTQNRQAFDFFKKFTQVGHMRMETAGSLQGGRQVWVLAKIPKTITLPGGDLVEGYLLMSSPHIWGKSFVIKFCTIRVVCWNTFTMAMNETQHGKGFRMPHIRAFDAEVAREAEISLGISMELFEGFEQVSQKLAKTKVDHEVQVRYVADIFQPEMVLEHFGKGFYKKSEAEQAKILADPKSPKFNPMSFKRSAYDAFNCIQRQPGAELESSKETVWGTFNAATYYIDHISGRDRDNALYSSWFGPKAVTKSQAYKRAIQLAETLS